MQGDNDRAIDYGQAYARRIFMKRGNRTEAHLSEAELAAMLAMAFEAGLNAGREEKE